jgi:integrase
MKTIKMAELAERYLAERVVSKLYAYNVKRVCRGCPTVSAQAINDHLRRRLAVCSTVTVRSERVILVSLWKWAYESGLIDEAPRGIMRIKARRAPTRAWTVEQLQSVVEATRKYDKRLLRSGADKGQFLRAWVLLGYECGARHGDLWRFTGEHISGDAISWTQSKTGDAIVRLLSEPCLEACRVMLKASPDGRILGWACKPRQAMRIIRELLDEVGVGGTSKWLRRSGATHCEMASPGAGRMHLGHRSVGLFESAYADWSQLRTKTPRTPRLA